MLNYLDIGAKIGGINNKTKQIHIFERISRGIIKFQNFVLTFGFQKWTITKPHVDRMADSNDTRKIVRFKN